MLRSKPDRIDIDSIKYQIEQGELKVPGSVNRIVKIIITFFLRHI